MDKQKLLSINSVCELTSLSRSGINKARSKNRFPNAVVIGEGRIAFVEAEISTWINERIASRDAAKAEEEAA